MTQAELDAAKAAFLARGGAVQQVRSAPAFGLVPEIDKQRRAADRARRVDEENMDKLVRDTERFVERVRGAAFVGGRRAALEEMQGDRYQDHTHYED